MSIDKTWYYFILNLNSLQPCILRQNNINYLLSNWNTIKQFFEFFFEFFFWNLGGITFLHLNKIYNIVVHKQHDKCDLFCIIFFITVPKFDRVNCTGKLCYLVLNRFALLTAENYSVFSLKPLLEKDRSADSTFRIIFLDTGH